MCGFAALSREQEAVSQQTLDDLSQQIADSDLAIQNLLLADGQGATPSLAAVERCIEEEVRPLTRAGLRSQEEPTAPHPTSAEQQRVVRARDYLKSLTGPADLTYDQLLNEVLRSVSSAASSSLAIDDTMDLSSSFLRTEEAVQQILTRKPGKSQPTSPGVSSARDVLPAGEFRPLLLSPLA